MIKINLSCATAVQIERSPPLRLTHGASNAALPDPFRWRYVTATGRLRSAGDMVSEVSILRDTAPAIAETHRVYRRDLLGCGLSGQPPDGYRYTPETIGTQILAVLDALLLPRVHWVGESSGGFIGLLLAAARPDRIASLVLCNTPTRIPDHIKRPTHWIAPLLRMRCTPWCWRMVPSDTRLSTRHGTAGEALCEWVVREIESRRTSPSRCTTDPRRRA
jgi:pimeloyl-ACP methyl ester carboxylesterase